MPFYVIFALIITFCVFYPQGRRTRGLPGRFAGFLPRCRDGLFGLPAESRRLLGGRPRFESSRPENQQFM